MYNVTHFRTEFIQHGQATIIRKVTMAQFLLMIGLTATGVGLFGAPYWLAPVFLIAGYTAGYVHNGEMLWKRQAALLSVHLRNLAGRPRIVSVQAEWEQVRRRAERQQITAGFPNSIRVE